MEQQGSTATMRQQLLLDELQRSDSEMSGQQLHRQLEGRPGAMGLATVYRNLRKLQQCGKVRCRHLPNGEALYAPVDRDEHHAHLRELRNRINKLKALEQCPFIHGVHVNAPETSNKPLNFNCSFTPWNFWAV